MAMHLASAFDSANFYWGFDAQWTFDPRYSTSSVGFDRFVNVSSA